MCGALMTKTTTTMMNLKSYMYSIHCILRLVAAAAAVSLRTGCVFKLQICIHNTTHGAAHGAAAAHGADITADARRTARVGCLCRLGDCVFMGEC